MNAVVIANGEVDPRDHRLIAEAGLLVAADGGARTALAAGRLPGVVAGDADSLPHSAELAAAISAGTVRLERHPTDKDETDTELALDVALAAGAQRIRLIGATGGERLDHEIANLLLLGDADLRDADLRVVHGHTQVRALHGGGRLALDALPGETVSLLPVGGDALGVRTQGLAYALDGETLRFGRARGVSNRVVDLPASVELDQGVLLVVELTEAVLGAAEGAEGTVAR